MGWGDLATWAGVVVSLAFSGLAWRHAKRAADAAERSAQAEERQLAMAEQEAEEAAAKYEIRWGLRRAGGSRHILTNLSDGVAHDVVVQGDYIVDSPVTFVRVGPHEAVEFFAVRTGGDKDDAVRVDWYRYPSRGGEPYTWRRPLP